MRYNDRGVEKSYERVNIQHIRVREKVSEYMHDKICRER